MLQLISPSTPDYQYSFAQAISINYHQSPMRIVLTRRQTNYIVFLYHQFLHNPTFIANRVNELWGKDGIRMSLRDVCDILVQAEEQSLYAKDHPAMIYPNAYFTDSVRHPWGLSQVVGGSEVDRENDIVFEKPKLRKRGCTVAWS